MVFLLDAAIALCGLHDSERMLLTKCGFSCWPMRPGASRPLAVLAVTSCTDLGRIPFILLLLHVCAAVTQWELPVPTGGFHCSEINKMCD